MQGSLGYLLPCNLLQPRWDLPTHPWSPETEEEGMPAQDGWHRWPGLPWAALYYLRVRPGKRPQAWAVTVEQKSTACERATTLGFLEARAPGSWQAAREHLSLADVSSQVNLMWGCTRMESAGCSGPAKAARPGDEASCLAAGHCRYRTPHRRWGRSVRNRTSGPPP